MIQGTILLIIFSVLNAYTDAIDLGWKRNPKVLYNLRNRSNFKFDWLQDLRHMLKLIWMPTLAFAGYFVIDYAMQGGSILLVLGVLFLRGWFFDECINYLGKHKDENITRVK